MTSGWLIRVSCLAGEARAEPVWPSCQAAAQGMWTLRCIRHMRLCLRLYWQMMNTRSLFSKGTAPGGNQLHL
jgi:hypothetical protein